MDADPRVPLIGDEPIAPIQQKLIARDDDFGDRFRRQIMFLSQCQASIDDGVHDNTAWVGFVSIRQQLPPLAQAVHNLRDHGIVPHGTCPTERPSIAVGAAVYPCSASNAANDPLRAALPTLTFFAAL